MSPRRLNKSQRFFWGSLLVAAFLVVLVAKMFYLQTARHEYLQRQALNNRIRIQPVVPKRGRIFDREGRVLVENRASYTLAVVPAEIRNTPTVDRVADLLELDKDEIDRRIRKNQNGRFQPALIKRDVGFEKIAVLEEQNETYPGAVYSKDQVRLYGDGLGSECFTGYVGEVSPDEMKNLDESIYRPGSVIGKAGIEKHYDRLLRGLEGTQYLEVAASGQILGVMEEQAGQIHEPGSDLVLTIDMDIQEVATNVFGEFCCGAVVAIDPRNGEVLAIVSKPSNDANIFSTVIPNDLWSAILADSTNPLLNRPLDGLYPPASTYKLVIAGAGLELGLIDTNTVFAPCTGGYRFGNRVFKCWEENGHGKLTMAGAIEQSCDVYFYQLGYKLGLEEFYKYSRACGFGKETGIDLPQEASGLVPNRAWYDRKLGEGKWSPAVILNLAIGQGEILCTPLQLAQFFCGLANNGRVYRPHLLKSVIGPDGRETTHGSEFAFDLPFSQKTIALLKDALIRVVHGEHGTAKWAARIKGATVGGKTGTAQNPHGENHAWFVGFAPADKPEIVVSVIVENSGHGSEVAAPAVRKILDAYLRKHQLLDSDKLVMKVD